MLYALYDQPMKPNARADAARQETPRPSKHGSYGQTMSNKLAIKFVYTRA